MMKKYMMMLLIFLMLGFLFACSDSNDDGLNNDEGDATPSRSTVDIDGNGNQTTSVQPIGEGDGNESTFSQRPIREDGNEADVDDAIIFVGIIEEINGDNAIVSIEEGSILNSGSKADIDLSVASDTTFHVGDKVRVRHDGIIREKFPLGINTIFVELIN